MSYMQEEGGGLDDLAVPVRYVLRNSALDYMQKVAHNDVGRARILSRYWNQRRFVFNDRGQKLDQDIEFMYWSRLLNCEVDSQGNPI